MALQKKRFLRNNGNLSQLSKMMNSTIDTSFSNYIRSFSRMTFSRKCLVLLYMFSLAAITSAFIMPIYARIGLSSVNPFAQSFTIGVLSVFSISLWGKELKWRDLILIAFICVFVSLSPIIYPRTTLVVVEYGLSFVLSCLPLYLVGVSLILPKRINMIINIARIGVVATIVYWVLLNEGFMGNDAYSDRDEYMGTAYSMLLPLLIVIWSEMQKHNMSDLVLSVIGFIVLLGFGTRGPFLCVLLYVALSLFIVSKSWHNKIIIIAVSLFCLLFTDILLPSLSELFSTIGLSSRVVESLAQKELLEDSGREWIFDNIIPVIRKNDVFGSGLFYDRLLLVNREGTFYTHNFFLEIVLSFGMYFGIVISLGLFILFVLCLKKTWGTIYTNLYMVFFCSGFLPLMFTGSFLSFPNFWLLLGISVSLIRMPQK